MADEREPRFFGNAAIGDTGRAAYSASALPPNSILKITGSFPAPRFGVRSRHL
jgi:hypothetical protein